MNILKTENLSKNFNGTQAVDHISFSVKEGEIFGLLGPNGAGKTTTINMLCTLLTPTSGTAKVAGYDVVEEAGKVRGEIGLVFQESSLDEKITAGENLYLHGLLYGMNNKKIRERMKEVLELVELSDKETREVKVFSGGMKRRLEIARGLIHQPKVLFLDEPTLGLDPQTRKHVWDYIIRLKKETKMTIILTTHYMEEAEKVCDRIGIIDHGKIIALDTPEKLKKSIGGESIILYSKNPKKVKKLFPKVKVYEDRAIIAVEHASRKMVEILSKIQNSKTEVSEVEYHKPSLNDVFLHLTGKTIREQEADFAERLKRKRKKRRRK